MTGDPRRREITDATGRVARAFDAYPEAQLRELAADLARALGDQADFSAKARALFATDASNYRQVPIGVVTPRTPEDALAALEICRKHRAPIVARGGGTALAGQTCNVAVVLDFSRWLDQVLWIDPERRLARVQPGCILDRLREAAEAHSLTFGPDPATHDHNTLGGMIGNNSCGVHSVMAGRTSDNVVSLDVVTYDGLRFEAGPTPPDELRRIIAAGGRRGEIYRRLVQLRDRYGDEIRRRYPKIPRRVSGFENLDALLPENDFNVGRALTGTEGSCVTILGATLQLIPSPRVRVLAVLGFDDVFEAADAVPRVLEHEPLACEGMDEMLIGFMRDKGMNTKNLHLLPEGRGWLIVEFGGDELEEAERQARNLVEAFGGQGCVLADPADQAKLWGIRESGLGATAFVPGHPDAWPGWEDSAVHPDKLGDYLRGLKALFHRHGYEASVYGHFGDGLIHCRVNFDLRTHDGIANWNAFMVEAADLATAHGGVLSGEHGDGQARADLLERLYGPELVDCFGEFKAIFDPDNRMNPGKAVAPFPHDSNLRIGPLYRPPDLKTKFAYPEDQGSYARAALRCVGVGKCRRLDPGEEIMCPSYLVTREEQHSTRGRARLLFEMVRGETITDGWKSREVEEALHLCLACKGCRSDCPVNVDMATYKAEFRSHHYAGRLRPRSAYSLGMIWWLSRAGGVAPGLANALLKAPGLGKLSRWIGGVATDAPLPSISRPFTGGRPRRAQADGQADQVMLWPDTFNNRFRPQTLRAAADLLQAAGYQVILPPKPLCCGRPLYDWGFLDLARSLWRDTLDALEPAVAAGVPVVSLEPACVSAFKDELPNLFPNDPRAKALSEAVTYFADFVAERSDRFPAFDGGGGKALLQVHCHHHAVIGAESEQKLLAAAGIEVERPHAGCCGMAGSFGLAADTREVSQAIGERALLPAVRQADAETLIVADGFSCREQIEHGTGRTTVHLAELLAQRAGLAG